MQQKNRQLQNFLVQLTIFDYFIFLISLDVQFIPLQHLLFLFASKNNGDLFFTKDLRCTIFSIMRY